MTDVATTNGTHAGRPKKLTLPEAQQADDQAAANLKAATKAEEKAAGIRAAAWAAAHAADVAHAAAEADYEKALAWKERTRKALRTAESEVK